MKEKNGIQLCRQASIRPTEGSVPVHKGEVMKSCGGEAVWVACSGQMIFCIEIKECGWAKQAKAASRDHLQKNPVRNMLSARGE